MVILLIVIGTYGWQDNEPFDGQSPRLNPPFLPSSSCDWAESCLGNVRWERRWDGLGAPFYWQVLFLTVLDDDVFPLSFLLSRTVIAMFFDDGRDFSPTYNQIALYERDRSLFGGILKSPPQEIFSFGKNQTRGTNPTKQQKLPFTAPHTSTLRDGALL